FVEKLKKRQKEKGTTSECASTSGSGARKRKPAAGTTSKLAADSGLPKKQKTAVGPSEAIPAEDSVPAEEKLLKVRTEFVKRVSDANLNQLLDKLLEHGFINDEEMQSVRTKVKAEKARNLIDLVREKGPEASSLLIDTLCELDQCVSKVLKLI
ncbi:caspase-1, partial [Perca flavescens]